MTRSIRNTNVCVVGGAGFLGSHLVNHLIQNRACNVLVVDNLCVGRREFLHPRAEFVHHDITGSEEFLVKLFKQRAVKYVFNYAAWPYIPVSFERPLQVFSVNATGAIKVINAAQEAGCEAILQVSSAEIYGGPDEDTSTSYEINEFFPIKPHSTYGAAKAAVDYYCQSAWKERGTPVISLRQFNCVGERETHPYVIPEIIGQLNSSSEGIVRLGNNSARDFIYAGDAVAMATELLEKGEFGEVYNLGSQQSIRIYALAKLIGRLLGREEVKVVTDKDRVRPWEIWFLRSDNSKIYSVISRRPEFELQRALERTIESYFSNDARWGWE